jgi:hypothetical protein
MGETLPPILASSFCESSFKPIWSRNMIKRPFGIGQNGSRANFWTRAGCRRVGCCLSRGVVVVVVVVEAA